MLVRREGIYLVNNPTEYDQAIGFSGSNPDAGTNFLKIFYIFVFFWKIDIFIGKNRNLL